MDSEGRLDRQGGSATAQDSKLGQSIWRRYGDAPGVISRALTQRLAGRFEWMGAGHLPLLADVQRRWAPAGVSYPGAWSALNYVQPAFATAAQAPIPYPGPTASSGPGRIGLQRTVSPRLVAAAGKAQASSDVRPASTVPGGGADLKTGAPASTVKGGTSPDPTSGAGQPAAAGTTILQRRLDVRKIARPAGGGAATSRPGAASQIPADEGVAPPGPAPGAPAAVPVVTSGADLGTAILQRQVELPMTVQKRGQRAASLPKEAGPSAWPGDEVAPPGPEPGGRRPAPKAPAAGPVAAGNSDLGTAILQRHLGGPAGRAMRRAPEHRASTVPSRVAVLQTDRVERARPPVDGIGPSARQSGTGAPAASSRPDIGTASLQPYQDGPARRIVRPGRPEDHKAATVQELPPPNPAASVTQPAARTQVLLSAVADAGHLATTILGRHLDTPVGLSALSRPALQGSGGPAGRVTVGIQPHDGPAVSSGGSSLVGSIPESLPPVGRSTMVQRRQGGTVPWRTWDAAQKVEQSAPAQEAAASSIGASPSRVLSVAAPPRGATGAQQLAMPLHRVAMPGESPGTWTGRSGGASPGSPSDTVSRKVMGRQIGGAEAAGTTLLQARPAGYGTGPAMPLRRAPVEDSVTTPETATPGTSPPVSTDEPPPSIATSSRPDSLDLERLADQVYAIIEQRLIVERESLGL